MTSTYCDRTGESEYALHMTEHELGLIADLLNSVNDLRAVPLRRAVNHMVRSNDIYNLLIERKIIQCNECKGAGNIRVKQAFNNAWVKEICPKCEGKCQKVAIITTRYETFSPYWANELTPIF